MGRLGTNLAPNLTVAAPGGRTERISPRVWKAVAVAALAWAAAGCGGPGEETNAVPPATVTAVTTTTAPPVTAAPTTTAPPATVAATTTTAAVTTTTAVPTTAAPTTTAAPATTVAPTAAPQPAGTVIDLEVTDGQIAGGARREAARLGEEVTIRVSGDSADHVHVHGYDLFLHLTEGAGELVFTADIPGVFEIELEEAGITLIQLEVS